MEGVPQGAFGERLGPKQSLCHAQSHLHGNLRSQAKSLGTNFHYTTPEMCYAGCLMGT